ncbi:MAG: hypothetical protein AAF558_00865 [Verrucomicrobiota bacterium]
MEIKQKLHDGWAQVMDGASFGCINVLQMRSRAGTHQAWEMEDYVSRWEGTSLDEFYRIPDDYEGGDLPESGSFRCPSPMESGTPENDHMHMDLWLGPKGWESPVMFMLHGVMSVSDLGYRNWAKRLNDRGWTAIFFHLPYHYGRKPAKSVSGEMALTSNLIRTSEGIRQAVIELRWVCRELKKRGVPHIGLWGMSYGGWIASLLSVLESMVSTAWLLEPIVDVDLAIWESPASKTIRRQLKKRGISRDLVRRHLPLVCPTYHQPLVDPSRILLVSGKFDRIAPPYSIEALHRIWKGSHYAEYRQGHVGYQLMKESMRFAEREFPELFVFNGLNAADDSDVIAS